ncbi:hypothetical protein UA08_03371 [Talaromyces atroroseus]|uniref:Thiamine-binding protein domain-containing protein n=1 Tax=Talaromyces atroroseus TaxID=1441469 RepID=A0A225ANU4_TALAT|nr:hypothetical protein UA08_03371 [Talaromyces atroroseus]OKL61143.1 hypothetical protein UA08_03371 [Talaromyces atroroseus]
MQSPVSANVNVANLVMPDMCIADFSLNPIGDSSPSYSQQIAAIQRLCQRSGVKFSMHTTGTTLEGPWEKVQQVIGWAHCLVHQQGTPRIQTDIRMSTRTDKQQPMEAEVASVEKILAA